MPIWKKKKKMFSEQNGFILDQSALSDYHWTKESIPKLMVNPVFSILNSFSNMSYEIWNMLFDKAAKIAIVIPKQWLDMNIRIINMAVIEIIFAIGELREIMMNLNKNVMPWWTWKTSIMFKNVPFKRAILVNKTIVPNDKIWKIYD